MDLTTVVSLGSQLERGSVDRPVKVDRTRQLRILQLNITRPLTYMMPFKPRCGFFVDDTGPWCPVCFNFNYKNLEFEWFQAGEEKKYPASPGPQPKGRLRGFFAPARTRYKFQNRAEQYDCHFCAVLLQIVDRFWKNSSRPALSFKLMVFENGSVELEGFDDFDNHSPTKLILFTPSGIASPQIFREFRMTTSHKRVIAQNSD